jgi:hypothetical protein
VAVGQLEQAPPLVEAEHLAGRVAGRADIGELDAAPVAFRDGVESRGEAVLRPVVEEHRLRPGQQRRALVNLVEGVGAQHQGVAARGIDHALGDGEQRLARTVHRQHLVDGIGRRNAVAARQPLRDRLAQGVGSGGRGIIRQALEAGGEGCLDEGRCFVLRLADGQAYFAQTGRRRQALEQQAQLLEGVGLELVEVRVHVEAAAGGSAAVFFLWQNRIISRPLYVGQ